ncbi:aldehyde dehydrogenase family protein [Nocardioides sp. NPDC006303]|uniref:aldehyde dehydrogenase family protein n=1 Tax=Nocardioides sp. NPDC006303 TaxID=3156747 RepID=UPI0033ADA20E
MTSALESLNASRGVHVDGSWRRGGAGLFDVEDPADRSFSAQVADGDVRDATAAVDAAAAYSAWRSTAPRQRADNLRRTFDLMHRDMAQLAELITRENRKSLPYAKAEVGYAAEFFRWFPEEAVRPQGDYGPSPAGTTRTIVTHRPAGVAVPLRHMS